MRKLSTLFKRKNLKIPLIIVLVFLSFHGMSTNSQANFDSLQHKCKAIMYYYPDSGLNMARQLLQIALENDNTSQEQIAYIEIAYSLYYLQQFDSCLYYSQKAIDIHEKDGNPLKLEAAYALMSDAYYFKGEHHKGIELMLKVIDINKNQQKPHRLAGSYKNVAQLYSVTGDFDQAMDYLLKSLEIFEKLNDSLFIADTYRIIAGINDKTANPKREKLNLFKARQYVKNFESNDLYRIVMSDIASIYIQNDQADSAIIIYDELIPTLKQKENFVGLGSTYISKGNALLEIDNVDLALSSYLAARSIFRSLNLEKYLIHTNFSIGKVFLVTHKFDSAEVYLLKSKAGAKDIGYSEIYEKSINHLSKLYEEKGNFDKAFNYYQLYVQYTDSIKGEEVKVKVADLEKKYETAKKQQKIADLEHDAEIQKSKELTLKAIIAGAIVVLLLLVLFFWQKRKKDKQIHKEKERLHLKAKELAQSELEKSRIKEEELEKTLIYKSKQLSTHALHMMQKNGMLQDILATIKDLSKKIPGDNRVEIKRLVNLINQSLRSDKDWEVFKLYFEEVNKTFFESIRNISPEITGNDLRLCALIKLNMNSKEMASVLNVAPNSIKSSRYRLKKKLGLDIESDLEEFIRNMN